MPRWRWASVMPGRTQVPGGSRQRRVRRSASGSTSPAPTRVEDGAVGDADGLDLGRSGGSAEREHPAQDDERGARRRASGPRHVGQSANRRRSPASSRPAPRPRASAMRALGPPRKPAGMAPAADPLRAATREPVAGRDPARRAPRGEHDRDAGGHRLDRRSEHVGVGVAAAGRGDDDARRARALVAARTSEPSMATVTVMSGTGSAAAAGITRQHSPPDAAAPEHDAICRDATQRPEVDRPERVVGVGMRLDHVIRGQDGATHHDHGPLPCQLRRRGGPDRVPQVRGSLVARVTGAAHRAHDHHRLRASRPAGRTRRRSPP